VAGKTLGERTVRLETYYIQVNESLTEIKEHLKTLNDKVAENSKFRLQQKTVYGVIVFAWVTVLIPLTAIAVAVLA
jgi:hypothetical protein